VRGDIILLFIAGPETVTTGQWRPILLVEEVRDSRWARGHLAPTEKLGQI